jgi:hypothetical protein
MYHIYQDAKFGKVIEEKNSTQHNTCNINHKHPKEKRKIQRICALIPHHHP